MVPFDSSTISPQIMGLVIDWSTKHGIHLVFLNTYRLLREQRQMITSARQMMQSVRAEKFQEFERMIEDFGIEKAYSFELRLELGFLPSMMIRSVQNSAYDFVILGMDDKNPSSTVKLIQEIHACCSTPLVVLHTHTSASKDFDPYVDHASALDINEFSNKILNTRIEFSNQHFLIKPPLKHEIDPNDQMITPLSVPPH